MNKPKLPPLISALIRTLLSLASTNREFWYVLIGFCLGVLLMALLRDNPTVYEQRTEAIVTCVSAGVSEDICLDAVEGVRDEPSVYGMQCDCGQSSPSRRGGYVGRAG